MKKRIQNKKNCIVPLFIFILLYSLSGQTDTSPVRVNQLGYFPHGIKVAVIVDKSKSPLSWELLDNKGKKVLSGKTRYYGMDKASGDSIHKADFSKYTKQGSGFKISVKGIGVSVVFDIDPGIYNGLEKDAMAYFYFHRMGIALESDYLANPGHAREALHTEEYVSAFKGWSSDQFDVRNSWADAGDFGIYPVNQAISAWILLNLVERYPKVFPDGSLNIPEKNNKVPDIIDEVRFGSTFMYNMLPVTGLASHKVTNENWSGFWRYEDFVKSENSLTRHAQPPSTNATYAVARNLSQLSRVYSPYDANYSNQLWERAQLAWTRAEAEPNTDYNTLNDDIGGGDYEDTNQSDDRFAAACELYLTAYNKKDANTGVYKKAVINDRTNYTVIRDFQWQDPGTTGNLSLLSVPNDLPPADLEIIKKKIIAFSDAFVLPFITDNSKIEEGYPVPWSGTLQYIWGHNATIATRMMMLAYSFDISSDIKYLKAMARIMDYFMGTNAMRLSFITGWGEYAEADTHDRWAIACLKDKKIPLPPGWLSGGPNNSLINDSATPKNQPAAKSYAPPLTADQAWCSKENTINWNAPLVWIAWYLNYKSGDLSTPVKDNTKK